MTLVAVLPPAFVAAISLIPSAAQTTVLDPAGQSEAKDFWWDDKPPRLEVQPPIVLHDWLVLTAQAPATTSQVFMRYLLDPEASPPKADERVAEGVVWQKLDATPISGALAAYTRVNLERDEVRMARLAGAELLFVNGEGFVGDPEGRGFRGVPIALRKGDNHLFVLGVSSPTELELWCPETHAVLGTWDVAWPADHRPGDEIAYPVFDASIETGGCLHIHYGHAVVEQPSCPLQVSEWNDGGAILPLGVRMAGSYFLDMFNEGCNPTSDEQAALVPVCVYFTGDWPAHPSLTRRFPPTGRAGSLEALAEG